MFFFLKVPKGRSAIAVTQTIRDKFFGGYKEAEFIVVCDVQKENKQIVQELNDAQVNLIHVAATCKNAADEKLRQSIRRFADIHGSPAAVILISGDINFAADLCDLRHRKKIHVILLHKENTSEALILCANEHYDFTQLTESLPSRTPAKVFFYFFHSISFKLFFIFIFLFVENFLNFCLINLYYSGCEISKKWIFCLNRFFNW